MFEYFVNFGRLCVKGINLFEMNGFNGCLFYLIMVGKLVDWDMVIDVIVDKIVFIIVQYGVDVVVFYVLG